MDTSSSDGALRRRRGAAQDAGGGASSSESANCASISDAKGTLVDSQGNVFSLTLGASGNVVYENGAPAGTSSQVTRLVYVDKVVSQENVDDAWWSWTGGQWMAASDPTGACHAQPSDAGSPPDSGAATLLPLGHVMWGINGATDQPTYAPTGNISLAQQIADLENVFGTAPNTILYRAVGEATPGIRDVVTTLQSAGIVPMVGILAYPDFTQVSNEAAAYQKAYADAKAIVSAAPTTQIFEIGNEWTLQFDPSGDGSTPADWRSSPKYALFRGTIAGGIAAIRDAKPTGAWIIGGATNGWTYLGLPLALAQDLKTYVPPQGTARDLSWDYTNLHWYDDAYSAGNVMGPPDSFNGGMNAYALLNATGKPLFVSEFGSSNHDQSSLNATAGTKITALMDNIVAHKNATSTERGVVGGTMYQLYQQPGIQTDYFLYTVQGNTTTLAPQGKAVQTWIKGHGNPT